MIVRATDHYVSYKSPETIASIALEWRDADGSTFVRCFDVAAFVKNTLAPHIRGGPLQIHLYDAAAANNHAYVTYSPLTIHCHREVWADAELGEPYSKLILAHEAGHAVLHGSDAKAFLVEPGKRISFAPKEYSAEWQAEAFGDNLLLPDPIVVALGDENTLVRECQVPREVAARRVAEMRAAPSSRIVAAKSPF